MGLDAAVLGARGEEPGLLDSQPGTSPLPLERAVDPATALDRTSPVEPFTQPDQHGWIYERLAVSQFIPSAAGQLSFFVVPRSEPVPASRQARGSGAAAWLSTGTALPDRGSCPRASCNSFRADDPCGCVGPERLALLRSLVVAVLGFREVADVADRSEARSETGSLDQLVAVEDELAVVATEVVRVDRLCR